MLRAEKVFRRSTPVLDHFRKILVAQRPGRGAKTGCVRMCRVLDGFPVPSEGQDGTLGAGG